MASLKAVATPAIGIVTGVVGAHLAESYLSPTIPDQTIFSADSYTLKVLNLVVALIGLVLMMFGGRIHRFVKYMGLGMFGYEIGREVVEAFALTGGGAS